MGIRSPTFHPKRFAVAAPAMAQENKTDQVIANPAPRIEKVDPIDAAPGDAVSVTVQVPKPDEREKVQLVLVQWHGPCDLLWPQVDVEVAHVAANGLQDLPRHVPDRPVRREPDARRAPVAVLDDRFMGPKVERHGQGP